MTSLSWEERFDKQYEPYPHTDDISSRWKYGAPSPISLKRFISETLATRDEELVKVLEGLRHHGETHARAMIVEEAVNNTIDKALSAIRGGKV